MLGRSVGRSDTGRKRRHNEDSFVLAPPLFAVADGMGGAQAGEIASGLAAETVRQDEGEGDGLERVTALVQAANKRVYERSHEDTTVSGMGTTMTLALLGDGVVSIGHVGDSRAYLVRDGELRQLTDDHSLVAELMRSGKLTPEEAEHHPQRSVITRALGTDVDVDVDTYTVEPRPGDVFLLCSDGLTSMVGNNDILRIVERHRGDLDATAQALIAAANQGGGEDNITVVCFEIASESEQPVERRAAEPDEEDTLSPIDRVPAVTTMVVPPQRIEEVFIEQPETPPTEKGARGKRVLVTLGLFVALAVFAALLVWGTAS